MKTITIHDTEYELQPFTAGQLRHEAAKKLAEIDEIAVKIHTGNISPTKVMPELVGLCCDLVHLSLSNKYPALTPGEIESRPYAEILQAVQDVAEITGLQGEVKPQTAKESR